jgi:hypothetical protein
MPTAIPGDLNLMRKLLIALFFAASAVAMTASVALAGGGSGCCS